MSSAAVLASVRHRFTREEYHAMYEAGCFGHQKVELIEGEIVDVSPQKSRHATAIQLAQDALRPAFGAGHSVRAQLPLTLGKVSEPEPDIAVVPGSPRDHALAHPATALLVVEVSDSRLAYDLGVKGPLYAEAGIAEFWVLDLASERLSVHRRPGQVGDYPGQHTYAEVFQLGASERITPLAAPAASIAVADLLP